MSAWLFIFGCVAAAWIGYGLGAKVLRSQVKNRIEDLEIDRELSKQRLNLLVDEHKRTLDEIGAAHKYFDQLRIPREAVQGKQLSITDRIGLVIESLPPTIATWGSDHGCGSGGG